MSSRRHPQDPQGNTARSFQRWLRRNPDHRRRHLENRLADDDETTHVLGGWAVALLLIAIVGTGLWRLFMGSWFPG